MLTYLLIAGWLARRLGLGGRGRSIAGVMLLILSLLPVPPATHNAWPAIRSALNAVASAPAVVWGLIHGGRPERRGGLLMVTGMRSGTGPRPEVMVGSVLLTRHAPGQVGAALVRHELRHADQWAVLGPLLMPPAYWLAEAAGDVLTDCGNGGNLFEISAGLRAGGYDRTTEVRCAGLLSSHRRQLGLPPPRWSIDWALPPALPVFRHSGSPRRRRDLEATRPGHGGSLGRVAGAQGYSRVTQVCAVLLAPVPSRTASESSPTLSRRASPQRGDTARAESERGAGRPNSRRRSGSRIGVGSRLSAAIRPASFPVR